MNILCCFKIVNDLDLIMEKDWMTASASAVDLSYAKKIINCYDEAGLETAIRIKEHAQSFGEDVFITAITVGDGNFDAFFKNLFAVGIDRILQVKVSDNMSFTPDKVSSILCEAAKFCRYDAVITGISSADGSNGLTPYLLAKKLGIPCIGNVTEIQYTGGVLRAFCDTGRGLRRATVNVPALYAIGNSVNPYLRMATLKQKLAVSKLSAEVIELPVHLEHDNQDAVLFSLKYEKSERHCVFIRGGGCQEMARNLIAAYPEVSK